MLNLNLWFIVHKNISKPLLPHPLGQSPSFDQLEFWPLRRWRPARVMPFYLGAQRMLNIAARYSNNTLSCSELNEEHAGEGFRSLRHILTPLWACKAKTCHFSRKFDLWPDLTRSNIDLGPKTICAIARSRRGASTGLFREALRPSGADRHGGVVPTPPLTVRVMRNALTGRGLRYQGFFVVVRKGKDHPILGHVSGFSAWQVSELWTMKEKVAELYPLSLPYTLKVCLHHVRQVESLSSQQFGHHNR